MAKRKREAVSLEGFLGDGSGSGGSSGGVTCVAFPSSKAEVARGASTSAREAARRTADWMRAPHAAGGGRTNGQALYAALDTGDGLATIPRAVLFSDPRKMVDSPDLTYDRIFQSFKHTRTDEGVVTMTTSGDGKRVQADLNPVHNAAFRDANDAMRGVLERLFPGRRMQNLVALRSLPGCQAQPKHTDYTFDSRARKEGALNMRAGADMPVLAFLALQDGTSLRVWPESHKAIHAAWQGRALPPLPGGGKARIARFDEGDLLLFRPDLVHAGDAYDVENVRLHAYMMSSSLEFKPNSTHIIAREGDGLEAVQRALK